MVPEAKLEQSDQGLVPQGAGWYVLNMRDAEWRHVDRRGAVCVMSGTIQGWRRESDELGVNAFVLGPGEPMAVYHWEADQEDFLVLSGQPVLIVDVVSERHSTGTLLWRAFKDPKQIQGQLGHSDPAIGMALYVENTPEAENEAAHLLGGLLRDR